MSTIKDTLDTLKGISTQLVSLATVLGSSSGSVSTFANKMSAAKDEVKFAKKALEDAKKESKTTAAEIETLKQKVSKAEEGFEGFAKANMEAEKELKKLEQRLQLTSGAFGKLNPLINLSKQSLSAAKGVLGGYASSLGITAFTLQDMAKETISYNKALFTLSRTQQVSGRGLGDLDKALNIVKNSTIMSRSHFVDFANSINSVYVGVKPSASAIADLASILNTQFGPSIEAQTEASKVFMDVQSKYPSLANQILSAQKAAISGDYRRAKSLKENTLMQMRSMGISVDAQDKMLQMMTEVSVEQLAMIRLNEAQAKSEQSKKDAVLAAGQASSDMMQTAYDASTKVTNKMAEIPGVVVGTKLAFDTLKIAQPFINAIKGSELFRSSIDSLKDSFGDLAKASADKFGRAFQQHSTLMYMSIKDLSAKAIAPLIAQFGSLGTAIAATGIGIIAVEIGLIIDQYNKMRSAQKQELEIEEEMAAQAKEYIDLSEKMIEVGGERYGEGFKKAAEHAARLAKNKAALEGGGGDLGYTQAVDTKNAIKSLDKAYASYRDIVGEDLPVEPLKEITKAQEEQVQKEKELATSKENLKKIMAKIDAGDAVADPSLYEQAADANRKFEKAQKDSDEATENAARKLDAYQKDIEAVNASIKKYTDSMKSSIEAGLKMGVAYDEAFEGLVMGATLAADVAEKNVKTTAIRIGEELKTQSAKWPKTLQDAMSGVDFGKMAAEGDIKGLKDAYSKFGNEIEKIMKSIDPQSEEYVTLKGYLDQIGEVAAKEAEYHMASTTAIEAKTQAALKDSSAAESIHGQLISNLEAEAQLMESAQFGMGASIEMMQRQVDAAMALVDVYKKGKDELREKFKLEGQSTEEWAAQSNAMEKATSFAELQQMAEKQALAEKEKGLITTEQVGERQKEIIGYIKSQWSQNEKIVKQQQKVYDLTKSMREGYLDAIREMSSGAGEFEKIIGTQEMGVSQILKTMKAVNGEYVNTMKYGGAFDELSSTGGTSGSIKRTDKEKFGKAYAARTETMGQYTTAGAVGFPSKERQEQMYRDEKGEWEVITGYGKTKGGRELEGVKVETGVAPSVDLQTAGMRETPVMENKLTASEVMATTPKQKEVTDRIMHSIISPYMPTPGTEPLTGGGAEINRTLGIPILRGSEPQLPAEVPIPMLNTSGNQIPMAMGPTIDAAKIYKETSPSVLKSQEITSAPAGVSTSQDATVKITLDLGKGLTIEDITSIPGILLNVVKQGARASSNAPVV